MKRVIGALVLFGLGASAATAGDKPNIMTSIAIHGGFSGVDIYLTNKGESEGMREANPLMRDHSTRYALWGLKTAVFVALDQTVEKKDRKWIRLGSAFITAAIVGNYIVQHERQKKLNGR